MLGLIALKFISAFSAVAFAIFMVLLVAALKIALVGLAIYFIIRIVSPDTARKLRNDGRGRRPELNAGVFNRSASERPQCGRSFYMGRVLR